MLGKNVSLYAPIAKAETMVSATSDASCPAFTLNDAGLTFTSTVKVGDLVVNTGASPAVSGYVTKVVSNTQLLTDEDLGFDADTYVILRPSEFHIRPSEMVEWVIKTVRCLKGGLDYRVGLWRYDGEKLMLLEDTKTLAARLNLDAAVGLRIEGVTLLCGKNNGLVVRNATTEAVAVSIDGINKTVGGRAE